MKNVQLSHHIYDVVLEETGRTGSKVVQVGCGLLKCVSLNKGTSFAALVICINIWSEICLPQDIGKGLVDGTGSRGVVGLNLVLSDKVFFSVDSGSLGHS